ncbi:hypothetical protein QWZ14_28625 [Paeniroseomonas aquatica]|uniref:Uncharacterized protein n=1 Tax=Paeniroseomonas aquatica TaxID=373043 RepID=A0ABT8AFQ5_9PROT|nr:hypothetical protein [Paeniroseomonas aquatica]MDN3568363.1 hypothetical protein [Paeniroseomonas aquatica]
MDTTWMTLGLFLLGCGAVPAVLALLEDHRQGRTPRIAQEATGGLSMAQCQRSAGLLRQLRLG